MVRIHSLFLAAVTVCLACSSRVAEAQWLNAPLRILDAKPAPRPPDSILVKFRPGATVTGMRKVESAMANVAALDRVTYQREIPRLGIQVYRLGDPSQMDVMLGRFRQMPEVLYAEPNSRIDLLIVPNDTYYALEDTTHALFPPDDHWPYQWPLQFIQASDAWTVWPNKFYTSANKPASAVKVAVIDTGVDTTHPDFKNAGGTSTSAALGGQLDMTDARNGVAGGNNPAPSDPTDEYGHGTHVSGIVGAATNNNEGVAAIGYTGQIMPIKVTDPTGDGDDADVVDGIVWAVDHGAVIINISLALNGGYSQALQDAVNYAWLHNVLIVAAAGNDGVDYVRRYPAACDKVLAVGATTFASIDTIPPYEVNASYSDMGLYVGIAAPGGDATYFNSGTLGLIGEIYTQVWSTTPTGSSALTDSGITEYTYGYLNGTSMASPHVAGLATLYAGFKAYSQATANAPTLIIKAIQKGADNLAGRLDGGWTIAFGHGRINAYNTLKGFYGFGRDATTPGCITGQVTYFGTPVLNAAISAVKTGTTRSYGASSKEDGTYRLANLPAGTYNVTFTYFGVVKTKSVVVQSACDTPATDMDLDASGISVTVTPHTASIGLGGTVQLSATVTGSSNTGVAWSIVDGPGTIDSAGKYYAPAAPPSPNVATVQATSLVDPTKFDTAQITVTSVAADLQSLSLNPTSVWGTQTSTATVVLTANAPPAGLVVNLSSSNTAVAKTPATVTVPGGASQTTFTVTSLNVLANSQATISGTYNGVTKSDILTVNESLPSTLTLKVTTVRGGNNVTGTVTMTGPAPAGGLKVNLTSSNTAAATVPLTMTVGAGKTSGTFTITTLGVSASTSSMITASARGVTLNQTLTINPAAPKSMTFTPSPVVGGNSVSATVTLDGKAPAGGLVVTLSSDKPGVAAPPATVTVAAGTNSALFSITTTVVAANTTAKISATANAVKITKSLTVTP